MALTATMRTRLDQMTDAVGRPFVERMAKEGFSIGVWYSTKKIMKMADLDDDAIMLKTLRWIMKYRCGRLVDRALDQGVAPSKLIAAIKNDKPLRITYVS